MEQFVRQAEGRLGPDRRDRPNHGRPPAAEDQDAARAAEVQHDMSADRVRLLADRLEEAIAAAEDTRRPSSSESAGLPVRSTGTS